MENSYCNQSLIGLRPTIRQRLDNFAQAVIDSITGNPTFQRPSRRSGLQAFKDNFTTAIATARQGDCRYRSQEQRAPGLLSAYRLASYVQIQCAGNLELLLSSGFQAQSTTGVECFWQSQPGSQSEFSDGNPSGQRWAGKDTSMYEGRIKGPTGDCCRACLQVTLGTFYFTGLTPGTVTPSRVRVGRIDRQSIGATRVRNVDVACYRRHRLR